MQIRENMIGINEEWENLEITSDFIFGKVMQNEELCKELLQRVFPEFQIEKLTVLELQKEVRGGYRQKFIRMDVYTEDGIRIFDVEMQMFLYQGMAERTRYYHSMIDANNLKAGGHYSDLKNTYVIFFCPFDPFGAGRSIYTFRNLCVEDYSLELKDGNETIFISSKGNREGVSQELGNFLDLMEGKMCTEDDFVARVKTEIDRAKTKDEWRQEYMLIKDLESMWYEYGHTHGKEEGLEEGIAQGRVQTYIELVQKKVVNLSDAAKACDMTEEEFSVVMENSRVS